jgi:hypothetical protein
MTDYTQFLGLAGAPFIAAIIEMAKRTIPEWPDRVWPGFALLLGVAVNVAIASRQQSDMLLAVLVGLVTGLAASGLYSQTKTTIGG